MSELLQSQLLQPINMTPIQPRSGESSLFLISAGGPGTASFNEFNPLFTSDGYTVQLNGMVGEHNTYGGDAIVAGIVGKGAFSVGYSGFNTDGFRANDDQNDQIFDRLRPVRLHAADERAGGVPAPEPQVRGHGAPLSSRTFTFPDERSNMETDTGRLGFRHAFSPESIVLASVDLPELQGVAQPTTSSARASSTFVDLSVARKIR